MCETRISPGDRSSIENQLPFDPDPSCRLDFGLHCVAADARLILKGTVEWKRSLTLAQLILDVERLRHKHAETCPECGGEGTICPS